MYLFGSTVNGLGFKGCDIDAYVDVGLIEAKKTEKGQEITSLERDSQTRAAKAIKRQLDLFHHQHVANVVFIAARSVLFG